MALSHRTCAIEAAAAEILPDCVIAEAGSHWFLQTLHDAMDEGGRRAHLRRCKGESQTCRGQCREAKTYFSVSLAKCCCLWVVREIDEDRNGRRHFGPLRKLLSALPAVA